MTETSECSYSGDTDMNQSDELRLQAEKESQRSPGLCGNTNKSGCEGGQELYDIFTCYLSQVTGTLQGFANSVTEKGIEIQKIESNGRELIEEQTQRRDELEAINDKAFNFERHFHDSLKKVLKKQKCLAHNENQKF